MTAIAESRADLLGAAAKIQSRYASGRSNDSQKQRGQFFTPPPVARLMASMLTGLPPTIRILDPGAGAGMLSAAVCERIARLRSPRQVEVHAYETDRAVLPLLDATLAASSEHLAAHGHRMDYAVHACDFVLHGPGLPGADLFGGDRFDVAILNPPYLKIGKDSRYALAVAELVHGQPNLYALFMALAAHGLKPGGQFVAITPRSFCNGLYFREFRRWFLSHMSLRHVRVFESRRGTFKDSKVLQESIITVAAKQIRQAPEALVSSSHDADRTSARRCREPRAASLTIHPATG